MGGKPVLVMDNFERIKIHLARFIELTSWEEALFISLLKVTYVKKKQWIVQPGFVSEHRNFIQQGTFRVYFIDPKFGEHTLVLAIEDWWINDFHSYINQVPATQFVEAMEDSIVLQLDHASELLLMQQVPKFETYFRLLAQGSLAAHQRRILSNLSKTAEERYEEYIEKYPDIVQRVPQYILASYLGVSVAFLSKVKARWLKR